MSFLLLVVGMIPSGAGLVDAKAGTDYVCTFGTDGSASSTFYTITSGSYTNSKGTATYNGVSYVDGQKLASATKVEFTATSDGKLILVYRCSKTTKTIVAVNGTNISAQDIVTQDDGTYIATVSVSKGAVSVTRGDGEKYLYYIEYIPDSSPAPAPAKYNVTVKDEKAATAEVTTTYEDGKEVTLSAAGTADEFLYWVNANDRVVSRNTQVTFPVYYSDTYTAVYKSAAATADYMTIFGQKYKSVAVSELSAAPEGPVRYGYTFDKWSMTVDEIKAAAEKGDTDIEVTPIYKAVTEDVSITVDGTATTYKKNTVVKASSDAANFSYWKNATTGDILSYNPEFYFFARTEVTITSVAGESSDAKGVVQKLDTVTSGTSKSFVFMFTVPKDCSIEFAGIAASSTVNDPSLTSADTLVRGRASGSTTVRYTWTKTDASTTTWNVKPILKYKDASGVVKTVEGSVVSY